MKPMPPIPVPSKGCFTLPTEAGQDDLVKELAIKWGADTIRDSDGTELSESLTALGFDIFSTVCLTRADQAFVRAHPEYLIRKFLKSDAVTAESSTVVLTPMSGFYGRKYEIDTLNDPKTYWDVTDRTTGRVVPAAQWEFDASTGVVTARDIEPWHEYTVNFLVQQIWDSTSMHNHLTNHWTCDPIRSVDPAHPGCYAHLMKWFDDWLATHPKTTVVRLIVVNNANETIATQVFDGEGNPFDLTLAPYESRWFEK